MSLRRSQSMNDTSRRRNNQRQKESGRMTAAEMSTSLIKAIRSSDETWMLALLAAGASANARDDHGRPPLCLLLETSGSPDACKALLDRGAMPNLPAVGTGQTAIHVAARRGFQVVIGQLLSSGGHPDQPDASGNSPLMYACANGHDPSARMLVKAGAMVGRVNQKGETGLHLAVKHGSVGCVKELLVAGCPMTVIDGRGLTPLLIASMHNQADVIQLLLENSCNVNDQDPSTGRTALHFAILNRAHSTITDLIRSNALLDIRDSDWNTAFLIAANLDDHLAAQLLVDAGCDVSVTDKSFCTALHLTAKDGYDGLIPIFVASGLNLDLKGPGGMTALMLAAFGGHLSVVRTLLRYGANPNILDRNRASALIYAILSNASRELTNEIVRCLIQFNADLDEGANLIGLSRGVSLPSEIVESSLEDRLYSPTEIAYLRGKSSLCLMLVRAGCDLTALRLSRLSKTTNGHRTINKELLQQLVQLAKGQRMTVPSLKELCRRPALERISQFTSLANIEDLKLSKDLIRFLMYEDIDVVPRQKSTTKSESDRIGLEVRSSQPRNKAEPPTEPEVNRGRRMLPSTPQSTKQQMVHRRLSKSPFSDRRSRATSETSRTGRGKEIPVDQHRMLNGTGNSDSPANQTGQKTRNHVIQQSKSLVTSVDGGSSGGVTPQGIRPFSRESRLKSAESVATAQRMGRDKTPRNLSASRVKSSTVTTPSKQVDPPRQPKTELKRPISTNRLCPDRSGREEQVATPRQPKTELKRPISTNRLDRPGREEQVAPSRQPKTELKRPISTNRLCPDRPGREEKVATPRQPKTELKRPTSTNRLYPDRSKTSEPKSNINQRRPQNSHNNFTQTAV